MAGGTSVRTVTLTVVAVVVALVPVVTAGAGGRSKNAQPKTPRPAIKSAPHMRGARLGPPRLQPKPIRL